MTLLKSGILALGLLATTATVSFAQKCNFDKDEKDEFTNEKVRAVKHKITCNRAELNWSVLMEQKGANYFMTVENNVYTKIDDVLPKGSKILLKLENGNILSVTTDDDCIPSHKTVQWYIITSWFPKGKLTKEDVTQLSQSKVTSIRMNIGGKDYNSPSVSGKEGGRIMTSAGCLLSE
jgi:hypothetical protein